MFGFFNNRSRQVIALYQDTTCQTSATVTENQPTEKCIRSYDVTIIKGATKEVIHESSKLQAMENFDYFVHTMIQGKGTTTELLKVVR